MNQGVARIFTALIGIPLVLGAMYYGGWVFLGFVTLVALAAQIEFSNMLRQSGWHVSRLFSPLLGLMWMSQYLFDFWQVAVLILILLFAVSTLTTSVTRSLELFSGGIASLVYPVVMISFLVEIQWSASEAAGAEGGFVLMLMLFVLIWATDTGAYYTGKSIGRHKLAPSISPNKTWEGTIGGILFAVGVAVLFKTQWIPELSWVDAGVLALLGGAWGQLGDLLESAFKRAAGVKDSASLLPGHGGILDRFDSIIFTAPAYYLYLANMTTLLGG